MLRGAVVSELTSTDAIIRHPNGESRVALDSVPLDLLGRAKLEQDARVAAGIVPPHAAQRAAEDGRTRRAITAAAAVGVIVFLGAIAIYLLAADRGRRKAREAGLIEELEKLRKRYASVIEIDSEVDRARARLATAIEYQDRQEATLAALRLEEKALSERAALYRDSLEAYDCGLYEPVFDFDISQKYKDGIEAVREEQKAMIKNGTAAVCPIAWTVNGSVAEGKKQTRHNVRLMLRAFNGEAEGLIADVRWNNVARMIERLQASFTAINKLGETHQTSISREYWQLKLKELQLVYEHAEKVQAEKEEQRRIAEQIREEERAQREIERALREAEDDERKYQLALERAREDLQRAQGEQAGRMERQIALLEERLREAEQNKQRAISRAQLTKSGHVYIISNIGSFGENMFKIGMTRRLDPLDRVRELGDASVPFEFDVHAVIYTDDAPALENLLHTRFGRHRVNLVNERKEFFSVSLDEIEAVLVGHGYKVELIKTPEAKAYRQTATLRDRGMNPFADAAIRPRFEITLPPNPEASGTSVKK